MIDILTIPSTKSNKNKLFRCFIFISTYFSHTDSYGHQYGPDSDEILKAIGEMDRTIGRLIFGLKVRGLFDKVNILGLLKNIINIILQLMN